MLDALRQLLVPLAQLAVERGLPHAPVDEMLRTAFVAAAHAAHPQLPEHRRVSRVSAATGINRREVLRLATLAGNAPEPVKSHASEVFAHWTTHPDYTDKRGRPRRLPRVATDDAPSFESLARAVTRDMHPRSLLEELLRLGLATLDAKRDTVELVRDAFVPRGDESRMLGFLGANVGDHLSAAVSNVLADGPTHFEQAMFASGLSERSLVALRTVIAAQWRQLTAELVPQLEQMLAQDDADRAALTAGVGAGAAGSDAASSDTAAAGQRIRIGLFTYQAPALVEPLPVPAAAPPPARARRAAADATPAPGTQPHKPPDKPPRKRVARHR